MDIGKYKQAMRPKKYLDGKFVIYDETMPDASDAQLGARDEFKNGTPNPNSLSALEKINQAGAKRVTDKVERFKQLVKQNKTPNEAKKIVMEEFGIERGAKAGTPKWMTRGKQELIDEGFNFTESKRGPEAMGGAKDKASKKRKQVIGKEASQFEERVKKEKTTTGFGKDYEMAHTANIFQAKKLGIDYPVDALAIQARDVNQSVAEILNEELEPLYKEQIKIRNKLKKNNTFALRKELDELNTKIMKVVATGGKQGSEAANVLKPIIVDPYNLEGKILDLGFKSTDEIMTTPGATTKGTKKGTVEDLMARMNIKENVLQKASDVKRPKSAMTREMFDRFNKLKGVLIPGLEEIKDSLKKLPDDIKSKRYFTAALKGLGIVATPLIISGMYNDFKSGKTVMETLERNLIGTDAVGGMKDIFALSPEEREARSVVKQAEMDEQIAQDFSGLDSDFQTPKVKSKMSLEEALKEYEEGLSRVELEREQEEAERAEGRASSFEGLKDLMLGKRFQPQEISRDFLAEGGPPDDPSKRKFMKIMGALAAVPVIGKYFNLAKPLTKAAPAAVETVKSIPPYFFKMVEKVKQFGDDVTKRFATQEREQVYNYRTSDADYELYEDLNTGDVRLKVIKGDPDFPGYKEQELTLTKGRIDEKTGNVPDEYDEYTVRSDFDGKMKDIDEGIEDIDDLIEDTIGFENVSIKELKDMGYDVNRLSPGFKKKLGIK